MPEDIPNTRALAGEPQKTPVFVKLKMVKWSKNHKGDARARPRGAGSVSPGTEKLQDLLARHLPGAVRVWVAGLKATKTAWNQQSQKVEDTGLPDHKERRESARAIVEYVVGKAIERSMEVSGSYKELSTLIDELRQSPEAQRLIGAGFFDSLLSGQSTTEGKGSARDHETQTDQESKQKTA